MYSMEEGLVLTTASLVKRSCYSSAKVAHHLSLNTTVAVKMRKHVGQGLLGTHRPN